MKIRIMAMLLAAVMLLTLLPGCGAAEAEPAATTMAATEAPTTEATTEPTTEPTTVPTEPLVYVETEGYELWDGAAEVTVGTKTPYQAAATPGARSVTGKYEDIQMQFAIVGSDRKEYREMVDTGVNVNIYEIPGTAFGDNIPWIHEKLEPFHTAWQKRESDKVTFEEWIQANADKKLVHAKISYLLNGTDLYLKTIEDGVKMKDLKTGFTYPDIVDAATGTAFCIREKYDPYKPEVGCWKIDQDGGEVELQAWFTQNYSWDVQEGKRANFRMYFEYYVLVPADYEDLSFCMHEYLTAEKTAGRLILGDSGKSSWGVGSIFDEEFLECTDLQFHFFGLKVKE